MVAKRLVFAVSTLLCLVCASWAEAEQREEIRWAYFDKPPLFVTRDDGTVGGICGDIGALLNSGMSEYRHVWQKMPVPRILDDMRNGANICAVGMIHTPEREEFLRYSLPCRLASPPMLAVRKADLTRLPVEDGAVSLREILESGDFVVGRLNGVSLGRVLDELMHEYDGKPQMEDLYSDQGNVYLFRMLRHHRLDTVPVDLFEVWWKTQGSGAGIQGELAYLWIRENMSYETGYVTCPDTPWGRRVIDRVNVVLRSEVPKPEYFQLFAPYMTKEIEASARKAYEQLVAQPAARME